MKTKLLILTISISLGYSTILNVPEDYPTIQSGINASVDGDTVLVAPGSYVENIYFNGKNILLISQSGWEVTEIDGGDNDSVVTFDSNETSEAVLNGFTIINGRSSYSTGFGGGIQISNASPTLINLNITENSSWSGGKGGGIFCENSTPLFSELFIHNNNGWVGGGIYLNYCDAQIENVIIVNNFGEGASGIHSSNSRPVLIKVTIADNFSMFGGGMNCDDNTNATITNTIIWNNFSGGLYYGYYGENIADVSFSNIQNYLWEGEGNISTDPLFTDPEDGDFTLQEDSPCIDTGDPDFPLDPDGTIADMGAYYFNQSQDLQGDINQDGEVNVLDIVLTVSLILNNEFNELADLNSDGNVNVLDIVLIVSIILE